MKLLNKIFIPADYIRLIVTLVALVTVYFRIGA